MRLINRGHSIRQSFLLINKDSGTSHLHNIIQSCDCVIVERDGYVITPEERNNIKVRFVADIIGQTFSKYVDIFYEENENPKG